MIFYCIHEGIYEGVQLRIDQLKAASESKNIEFICIDSLLQDYTAIPKLGHGDLFYNIARGSVALECLLLNDEVTTFYIKNPQLLATNTDSVVYTFAHEKAGIPQPKTIYNITSDRLLLKKYIDYLGGFPIIIKATASTRGIGTIKVESWANLFSTIDFLLTTGGRFILREFIKAGGVGRCRVLGDEVIQTYEFPLIENDFRTSSLPFNDLKPVIIKDYSDEFKALCVKATHLANIEYAAVDIMIDEKNNPYILEVNFPAGLPLNWKESGNVVALKMIEYLIAKALRNGK